MTKPILLWAHNFCLGFLVEKIPSYASKIWGFGASISWCSYKRRSLYWPFTPFFSDTSCLRQPGTEGTRLTRHPPKHHRAPCPGWRAAARARRRGPSAPGLRARRTPEPPGAVGGRAGLWRLGHLSVLSHARPELLVAVGNQPSQVPGSNWLEGRP